jgi:vesicular inhibitory amino acid transporter
LNNGSRLLQAGCVEYLILEGDNLSAMFPNASLTIGGLKFTATEVFTILTAISVLPTVWLRDLRLLAYISGKKLEQNLALKIS